MTEFKLQGSGGYIIAELTEEQAKKADLGVGKLFLAPIGKLEEQKMSKHYCKNCESEVRRLSYNPEAKRERDLKKSFGITTEDYNEMFGWEQQSNDEMMRDKSLREWNGRVRTTLERLDF